MEYVVSICDDSPADRGYLSALVIKWAKETGREVRLSAWMG